MILEVREAAAKRSATCPKVKRSSDRRSVEKPSEKRILGDYEKPERRTFLPQNATNSATNFEKRLTQKIVNACTPITYGMQALY